MKKVIKSLFKLGGFEVKRIVKYAHVTEKKSENALDDDFNWNTYNEHYRNELENILKTHTEKLSLGDYTFENNILKKQKDILPLHPNHRLLYETIILLNPSKITEFGCGGGDHLYNLNILLPNSKINGLDRADAQLSFSLERSALLKDKIQKYDITMPFSNKLPLVDVSYTQAVLMHIHSGNGHIVALSNLFKVASKQVVLMENWTRHPFLDEIKYLFEQGMIPWESIYFYFRRAPEIQNSPYIMVISSTKLPFEELEDYSQLIKGMNV